MATDSLADSVMIFISLGSMREVQSMLMILNQEVLLKKADILGAHLYRLFQNPGGL